MQKDKGKNKGKQGKKGLNSSSIAFSKKRELSPVSVSSSSSSSSSYSGIRKQLLEGGETLITTNTQTVLNSIEADDNFIAIGELHNSRSSIQFIMENIELLAPKDGKKTYFLTEFLPTGMSLTPNSRNEGKFLKAKIQLPSDKQKQLTADTTQRESDKEEADKSSNSPYTLLNLYKLLFSRGISLISIEYQNTESKKLNDRIKAGHIDAYKERVNQVNSIAIREATRILKLDTNGRILIFAGMGHTAGNNVKKHNKDGSISQANLDSITKHLNKLGHKGISISTHDLNLCTDREQLKDIELTATGFTKYETNDDTITFDQPQFLLFIDIPPTENKSIRKGFENIFLPGECGIDVASNPVERVKYLGLQDDTSQVPEQKTSHADLINNFGMLAKDRLHSCNEDVKEAAPTKAMENVEKDSSAGTIKLD